jgi:hypothetical protein
VYLDELLDKNGLRQDEWSLTVPKFGKDGQLTVIGWSGKTSTNTKYYILRCLFCVNDSELCGDGIFRARKSDLKQGKLPCLCAKSPRYTEAQYTILLHRVSNSMGYSFIQFIDGCVSNSSKIEINCKKHGAWITTISQLVNKCAGCRKCYDEKIAEHKRKPDDDMIISFLATDAFHPETKFWRSERKNGLGWKVYWNLFCPECGEVGESTGSDLVKGHRPCACSPMRQKLAYINIIHCNDSKYVKFGVAIDTKRRTKRQNRMSKYNIQECIVYEFESVFSCRSAERECLQELECSVLSKAEVPDGYTETTYFYNIDRIIEIYKRNGGWLKL